MFRFTSSPWSIARLRSKRKLRDSPRVVDNSGQIGRLCSMCKHNDAQHKVAGRLEMLENVSTLGGYTRREVRSYSHMKLVRELHTGHGYSRYKNPHIKNPASREIVKALRSGERSRASSLLSEIGQKNQSLDKSDFIDILKQCAQQPDPLFTKETERLMREKGVNMDMTCHSLIIRALCRGGLIEEAFNEINILRNSGDLEPILPMFNDLLGGCARSQSHHVSECLDLMEDQMVGKNERTYTQLLELAVSQGNLVSVHEIWKECTKYYTPDILSLRKFIWSFSWLGDSETAYDILQKTVSLALRGDFSLSKTATGKVSITRIDVPIPSSCKLGSKGIFQDAKTKISRNDHDDAELRNLRRNLSRPVKEVLLWCFNVVIRACARKSDSKLPEKLIVQMQDLGLEPSASTYDGYIKAVVAERGYPIGLELLEAMREKKMEPHDSTLVTIATACSKALNVELAERLLNQVSTCPAYPFDSLLQACDTLDQPERAIRVLAKMKKLKLPFNIRTYELLFSLFGNYNAPYEDANTLSQADVIQRINAIEDNMVENNIQHSATSMQNMLGALGAEGLLSKLMQSLRMAENQLSRGYSCLTTSTYNVVLHSLVKAEESDTATEIFKSMKSNGFPPDAATYEIMMECCSLIRCPKSASAIISIMIREGFYTQAVTYTSLIKVGRDIYKALEVLDKANREGIKPDVVMYNTILDLARKKGSIDIIELLVDKMHQNKVQPDSSTCSIVFSAYIEEDYFNTAMGALQVLSMRMISLEERVLEEKKMEFEENFIFAEDSDADLRILEYFKSYEENLVVALLNLRWCATLGFEISWLPDQSHWVKRLSSNYTPVEEATRDSEE